MLLSRSIPNIITGPPSYTVFSTFYTGDFNTANYPYWLVPVSGGSVPIGCFCPPDGCKQALWTPISGWDNVLVTIRETGAQAPIVGNSIGESYCRYYGVGGIVYDLIADFRNFNIVNYINTGEHLAYYYRNSGSPFCPPYTGINPAVSETAWVLNAGLWTGEVRLYYNQGAGPPIVLPGESGVSISGFIQFMFNPCSAYARPSGNLDLDNVEARAFLIAYKDISDDVGCSNISIQGYARKIHLSGCPSSYDLENLFGGELSIGTVVTYRPTTRRTQFCYQYYYTGQNTGPSF